MKRISQLPVGHNLTGTEQVPIIQDSETRRVPASYFMGADGSASAVSFPAHDSLTSADIGKLVMNVGGSARVSQRAAPIPGQAGKWKLTAQAPIAPRQAEFQFKFLNGESVIDGYTFSFWGITFTFRDTATAPLDIQIGANDLETAGNLFLRFNNMGGPVLIQVSSENVSDGRIYTLRAGETFPGASGNTLGFSSATGAFSLLGQTVSGKNNDLDNVGKEMFTVQRHSDGYNYMQAITLGDILGATSAYGIKIGDYRWPATAAYMLGNVHLYLASNTSFLAKFTYSWNGDMDFEINEASLPSDEADNASIAINVYAPVPVSVSQIQESTVPQIGFVIHPILGVLKSINAGTAKIDNGRLFKVRLAHTSDPVVFDTAIPAKIEPRMLVVTNNGEVARDLIESDNLDYYANGIMLAQEEAGPGNELLVEWIKILGH